MSEANWYADVFKGWQAKQLGPKPTAEQLATIHHLGARPGKQALAIAMALREHGVTGSQIVMVCGAPQLNKMRGFITDALLKREPAPPSAMGHTVYKLTVTPKGLKRIERAEKAVSEAVAAGEAVAAEKPVKAKAVKKATSKARKPKVVKVTGSEPETVVTAEQAVIEHSEPQGIIEQPAA